MAELSERQRRAVSALLTAPTVKAAAQQAGVGERTLRRWLTDPRFREAYRAASRRMLEDAAARLRAVAREAVDTLLAALQDDRTANRIRAPRRAPSRPSQASTESSMSFGLDPSCCGRGASDSP